MLMKSINQLQKIRISIGSASVLQLNSVRLNSPPTTCYLMTASSNKCMGSCQFCPQGRASDPKITDKLSRIQWPEYPWKTIVDTLNNHQKANTDMKFQRICIQVLNYPTFFTDTKKIVQDIRNILPSIPISSAIPPISLQNMKELKEAGLTTIAFALDACTPELFAQIKGREIKSPYRWDRHQKCLTQALDVFGVGHVTTHLIVGIRF